MKRTILLTIALVIVTAATGGCGEEDRTPTRAVGSGSTTSAPASTEPVRGTGASPTTSASTASGPAPTSTPPTTARPPLSASSRLRIDGIGPIDVGMTVAEARAAAGVELSLESQPYCSVLTAPGGPEGVALIVTPPRSGRIDLIIVKSGPVATVSGIRIGSTDAEVRAAYPGKLRAVNPSLPVHRLIYHADDPAFADRAVVFVIDNSRVASMYSGLRNQAEADEICG